jgi:regulator of sigma E protease
MIYDVSIALLAVGFVLGVMILVHEYGHYAAAKLLGVRVEVFSIGFGKRLFGFRRGETDYRISALPLGGYVKMSGENPMDTHTGDPGEFSAHPRWHRLIIAFAGPMANIVLAIALLTAVFMFAYPEPMPPVVGQVAASSPAAQAGIQAGDRITAIDGVKNPTWEDVELRILLNAGQQIPISVQRGEQVLHKSLTPVTTGPNRSGEAGLAPNFPVIVSDVRADMPAGKAGMKPGDRILSIDGRPIYSLAGVQEYLQTSKDKPVQVLVERGGEPIALNTAAVLDTADNRYKLGFSWELPTHLVKLPFTVALQKSLEMNKRYALLIVEIVERLVTRRVSIKQIDGPIGIARVSGQAAQMGIIPMVMLMALISLNLGIFNLFPIPIMDGGVILLLLIESVMRRDISLKVKERIYQVAFIFLIMFAAVVIVNDITKLPGVAKFLQ